MQEKGEDVIEATDHLADGGFGVVAGTGTGKTVAIRDINKQVLQCEQEDLRVDIITREHEATDYTWTCNVLVITPGVALHWLKNGVVGSDDLIIIDEIHQTSEHLELSMALAKRAECTYIWMSATIDPKGYRDYLNARKVIECSAFDAERKSKVETSRMDTDSFLTSKVDEFIEKRRGVAVFVPTRAMAENLSRKFSEKERLYCDFYHGGEKAEKLRQFLTGQVDRPFMVFMTIAGASSLNIQGLDTVVIMDEMYTEVVHSGVKVLEKIKLGNNELLQMGGRVNGRAINGEIYILTSRDIDFHELKPTAPAFVLGGDLETVALTCARLDVDLGDLDLITEIDHDVYRKIVDRFKSRGIIQVDGTGLTSYGKQVERLPVSSNWAENLVHAEKSGVQGLLDVAVVCASIESFYAIVRKEPNLSNVLVSESDYLTGYNIVASALRQFGMITKMNGNGEVGYTFRGNFVRRRFDKKTQRPITDKGEFVEWCDENGFSGKAIKEVTLAMKSIYRQLGIRLPNPQSFMQVVNNNILHESFLHLLAKVQSLDFVRNEHNSQAGTVWSARHSCTNAIRTLGRIRFWRDKRNYQRATIEGMEVPEDILNFYAKKTAIGIESVVNEGVRIRFKRIFAGEVLGEAVEVVADADVPDSFKESAEKKFIASITSIHWFSDYITEPNKKVREKAEAIWIRSGGSTQRVTSSEEQALYEQVLSGKGIFSVDAVLSAILADNVDPCGLLLKLEDFVSVNEQEKVNVDNPAYVEIENQELEVEYLYDRWGSPAFTARVKVTEDFVRKVEIEAFSLPSDRQVELECQCYHSVHRAMSFLELVEKLEISRIKEDWENAKGTHQTESASDIVRIQDEFLSKVGTVVEVSQDSEGNSIYGFICLYCEYSSYFALRLAESVEDATAKTANALAKFAKTSVESMLSVPQEAPFQKESSGYFSRWGLTELGESLRARLEKISQGISHSDLTPQNVVEKIEVLKLQVEKTKKEVAGNFYEISELISSTESQVLAEVDKIGEDNREFVSIEIETATDHLVKARQLFKELSYEQAKNTCQMAFTAMAGVQKLAESRSAIHVEIEQAVQEIDNVLYDIVYGYEGYEDLQDKIFERRARSIQDQLNIAFGNRQYETVSKVILRAISLIAEIEIALEKLEVVFEKYRQSAQYLERYINQVYSKTSFYERQAPAVGEYISLRDDDPIFPAVYAEIDNPDTEYVRFIESRLNDKVIVWLEARRYDDNEIEFYIRTADDMLLEESDIERIEVISLWQVPNEGRLEKLRQIHNLEIQLAKLEEELELCGRDYAGRIVVQFKQDPERGSLFAVASLSDETEVRLGDDYKSLSGEVRFVCNNRCGDWLNEMPEAGEKWICSFGVNPRMIGYDRENKPIIVVNPQAKDNHEELAEKLEALQEEINVVNSIEEIRVDEESSGSLGAAMLQLMQDKEEE